MRGVGGLQELQEIQIGYFIYMIICSKLGMLCWNVISFLIYQKWHVPSIFSGTNIFEGVLNMLKA